MIFKSIHRKLDLILGLLGHVEKDTEEMTQELQLLTDQVKANADVTQSAVKLIQGLADQLHAAAEDPAAIRDLANQLKNQSDALAQAVVANTPADNGQPAPAQPPTT